MFGKKTVTSVINNVSEDKLYEIAVEEIEENTCVKGLWGRALAQSNGDKDKAESLYIKLRVERLKDELFLTTSVAKDIADAESAHQQAFDQLQRAQQKAQEEADRFADANAEMYAERDKSSPFAKYGFWTDPRMRYPGNTYIPLATYAKLHHLSKSEVCEKVKARELEGKLFSMEPYIYVDA